MEILLSVAEMSENEYTEYARRVLGCPFGAKHFCDGTPNRSRRGEGIVKPCGLRGGAGCPGIRYKQMLTEKRLPESV